MAFGGNLEPVAGLGTILERGDGGDPIETFFPIAHVFNLTGPGLKLNTVDNSTITSPGQTITYLNTQVDSGEISLSVNFLPKDDSQLGLILDLKTGALRNFKLVFPDGEQSEDNDPLLNSRWEFAAYVTAFSPSAQLSDRLTANISLQLSGETITGAELPEA